MTAACALGHIAIRPTINGCNHLIISFINRVSGYIIYNLTLTASEAMPATWGNTTQHNNINRGAVADSASKGN